MPVVTVTIPLSQYQRVLDGFAQHHGRPEEIIGGDNKSMIPNPETKEEFLKRKMIEYVKRAVMQDESRTATAAASKAAEKKVKDEVGIT